MLCFGPDEGRFLAWSWFRADYELLRSRLFPVVVASVGSAGRSNSPQVLQLRGTCLVKQY